MGTGSSKLDLLIRGGTFVDGTGLPRYTTDVGIAGGRVVEIGRIPPQRAERVLDADGLVVAPGFVDLHTHYDAPIQWDPWCSISGWHGVTSVALGNCGFGFAPVHPDERERSMLTMSRTEAIPMETMREGMVWDWETFPEWLDTLDRIPKGVNCLSYLPLAPLMTYVMGLEAAKSRSARPAELERMQQLMREALAAGACGWSAQRMGKNGLQNDYDGTPMVTDTMSDEDAYAFARVLGEKREGFIQITQATGDGPGDFKVVEKLAELSGCPILYNVVFSLEGVPQLHRGMISWIEDCQRRGLRIFGQGQTVRATFYFSLDDWNLYDTSPAWREATTGTREERIRKLSDPDLRARMIADVDSGQLSTFTVGGDMREHIYQGAPNKPEHDALIGLTVGEIAERQGKHRAEVLIDLSLETDLHGTFLTKTVSGVQADDVAEILASPFVFPGVSDGGAHTKFLTTGSFTTDTLAWLVRDEQRLTLEQAHYKLSYLPAHAAGFRDRGFLREGAPADIVVYELDRLERLPAWNDSEVVHDLPGGEWRRVQHAQGYRWILVNGEITFENDVCTGATPGRLLRHGAAA
jgi:N-acyl-D-amino-acid deacylase